MGTVNVARDLKRMSRAAWRKGDVEKGVNYWGFSEFSLAESVQHRTDPLVFLFRFRLWM